MKDRILKYKYSVPVLYSVFFLFVFLLFLVVTFPTNGIRKRLVSEINANSPYRVEIKKVDISPFLNINLDGVTIRKSAGQVIHVDHLQVKPSIMGLLGSSSDYPFTAKLLGGEVKGTVSLNNSNQSIKEVHAAVGNLRIDDISGFIADGGNETLSLQGELDGVFHLVFDPAPRGNFNFVVKGLNITNIKVKGMNLPSFTELNSTIQGDITGRETIIKEWVVKGDEFDLNIKGTTPLIWEMNRGGVIDLGYNLQITGRKFAMYKNMLRPYLAQRRDGSLGGKIIGTINNPEFKKDSIKRF